jgi:hypothetical protein
MESIYFVVCWACHRKCRPFNGGRFPPHVRGAPREVVDEAKAAFPRVISDLPDALYYLDLTPLEHLRDRFAGRDAPIVVLATGDPVTPAVVDNLPVRCVRTISCPGLGGRRVGMRSEKRNREDRTAGAPVHSFFGVTQDARIGAVRSRGRAMESSLSNATVDDHFCSACPDGLGFLNRRLSISEVLIAPNGDVFLPRRTTDAPLGNLCVGCDRIHREELRPEMARIRADRLAVRRAAA